MCCKVFGIDMPEIQKQPGAMCRHGVSGRCEIHQTRPDICRNYYCGWRRLEIFGDDWRPDRSGVLVELGQSGAFAPYSSSVGFVLVLIKNPFQTIREERFINFVINCVKRNVCLFLSLPGPRGRQSAGLSLNTPELLRSVCLSHNDVLVEVERVLERLLAHEHLPYPAARYSGRDVSIQEDTTETDLTTGSC